MPMKHQEKYLYSRGRVLFCADALSLTAAFLCVVLLRGLADTSLHFVWYMQMLPLLFICLLLNFFSQLYTPTPLPLHEELSRLTKNISSAYLFIAVALFLQQRGGDFSRFVLLAGWAISLGMVPLGRYYARRMARGYSWWGPKAVIFGQPEAADNLLRKIRNQFDPVLRPVAYAGTSALPNGADLELLPTEKDVRTFAEKNVSSCAIVVLDSTSSTSLDQLINTVTKLFRHVILMPNLCQYSNTPVSVYSIAFETATGFKVCQNLFDPKRQIFKRAFDIILSCVGLVFLFIPLLIIAALIFIQSPGSPFFLQKRIGLDGKHFFVLKFRTMVRNAEEQLEKYLESSPELAEEWARDQKLRNDPRLIRMGAWLRRTSVDELPQLWNVLKGDMSLVGPRPIVDDEIVRYGSQFELYTRVRPGITGLWQVSGRNDCSYEHRVKLDQYYILNWSIMLDLLILFKTIPVVLKHQGSY